ncbi:MAG TPA: molybdate ABC transporter permease subunit, partial [Actinomycetota bacterium]|nr:molybdate ABC transporter permease subunit [Actinomycetota bacterium]
MSARTSLPTSVKVLAGMAVAAVGLPLVALVVRAPWSDIGRLGEPGPRTALLVSIEVSLAAAAVAFVFGVPVALVLARASFRGRSVVRSLALL